jgi:hypothetical protein
MSQHHDPVHPDAPHLTAETLADLDLGLLDAESADHASAHLEHCAQCTALHTDLAELTASLHRLPENPGEPMPDAVWEQVSHALAAEPVRTSEDSSPVASLDAQRRRRWGRPGIGAVAGIAGIALASAIAVPWLMSNGSNMAGEDSSGGDTVAEGAQPLSPADFAATRSGTHYKQEELGQQVTQLVASRRAADAADQMADGSDDSGSTSPSPSLSAQVTVSPTPSGTVSPPGSGLSPSAVKLLRTAGPMATSPAAAQACLADYLDVTGVAPLAVDIGLWQGKPAAVIVLPLDDPTLVQVWVIDPTCDTTSGQDPLYYYATVSR